MEDVIIQQTATDGLVTEQVTTELLVAEIAPANDAGEAPRAGAARSDRSVPFLAGIATGAALMYFFDADRGTRRRHMLAAQLGSSFRSVRRDARDAVVDVRNRAKGFVAETRGRLRDERVDGDQLVARVRAELGRHVEQARAIEVVADGGTVTLRGQVLAEEQPGLLAAVAKVRGVESVNDQLEVQQRTGSQSSLQR